MKLFFNLLTTASLVIGQFAAPINNASSISLQEPPTPTATELVTETPTVTATDTPVVDVSPSATATEVIPSETPTVTASQTPLVTSTVPASPTPGSEKSEVTLTLSATPDFLPPSSKVMLHWEIVGLAGLQAGLPLKQDAPTYTIQFFFPVGVLPEVEIGAEYNEKDNILTVPIEQAKGQFQIGTQELIADEIVIEAVVLEKETALTDGSLVLTSKEEHEVKASGGEVLSEDGRVNIQFPQGAITEDATVFFGKPSGDAVPEHSLSGQPFEIKAQGKESKTEISRFNEEIGIEVEYESYVTVPEGTEDDLYLWWYNPQTDEWVALPSEVDVKTKTLRAHSNHFTVFDIGFNTWNASHVPTTDAFQVAEFTGAGTYSLPIEVPAGPGGFQPSLSLSYNSQVIDQSNINPQTATQASWTGMGWSLDTGSIELDYRISPNNTAMLSVNGVSSRIVQDSASGGYHLAEENGWKIDLIGGLTAGSKWVVKDTTGNTYEFEYIGNYPVACVAEVPHKWMLTKQTNSFGQSILYSYVTETRGINRPCGAFIATTATYISTITYPNSRYRVRFELAPRTDYLATWETGANFYAFQKSYLKNIYVEQDTAGNGSFSTSTVIRRYELVYNTIYAIWPSYTYTAGGQILTLNAVKQYGEGGASLFQTHTFSYADYMHLTQVNNGFGGIVTFDYPASLAYASPNPRDEQRQPPITNPPTPASAICTGTIVPWILETGTVTCTSSTGYPAVTVSTNSVARLKGNLVRPGGIYKVTALTYSNVTAQVRLGIKYANGVYQYGPYVNGTGAQASVSYTTPPLSPTSTTMADMVIGATAGTVYTYAYTYEPLPTFYRVGTKTVHDGIGHTLIYSYAYETPMMNSVDSYEAKRYSSFYGHGKVTVTSPDGTRVESSYFQTDALKGKPYLVSAYSGNLASTTSYGYSVTALPVLWTSTPSVPVAPLRNWIYTFQMETALYDVNGAAVSGGATKTNYTYNANYNLSVKQEYGGSGLPLYRTTTYDYFPNTTNNITGLVALQSVTNASGTLVAQTLNLYDDHTVYNTMPTAGNITGTRTWVSGVNFTQTSYGYDAWGNQTSVTTYTGLGTGAVAPTTGAVTATTTYDSTYHTYPVSISNGVHPATTIGYNYTHGVPTSETDANGATTSATYDAFGRITSLTRPLDAGASLTMSYTSSFPFTTSITQTINATQSITLTRVYDGMGRVTQTNTGGVITDTIYDSATVTRQSTPYTPPEGGYYTTTTVNPAARTTTVTAPDGTTTSTTTNGLTTTTQDEKFNATITANDVWGRVTNVTPPTGPSVAYTYDVLDHLKTATRGGVTTTLTYNSAGQKTSMTDPDMGYWTYGYDALGNLTYQIDARSCQLSMTYDPLNRLTNKSSSGAGCGTQVNMANTYDQGTNGIGRRTYMSDASGSTTWAYDARGRMTNEVKNISGTNYTTSWTYNLADLPITTTYPDNEVVTTTYNNRMLVNSVAGASSTYVSSTAYDSAGRMTSRALGNGLTQTHTYNAWNVQGGRLHNLNVGSLQNINYTYDPAGNITQIQDLTAAQTQSFAYDSLNRLTSANAAGGAVGTYDEAYTYDLASGNLASKGTAPVPPTSSNPGYGGLAAWWKLEESRGVRSDSQGANHLTDVNTVMSNSGVVNSSVDLVYSNGEYLTRANHSSLQMGTEVSFTIGSWVYVKDAGTSYNVMTKWSGGSQEYLLGYYPSLGNKFVFWVSSNGANYANVISPAVAPGAWHFVVMWHDAAANTINIQIDNGTITSTAYALGVFPGTSPLNIGLANARLDETFIYKRTLSPAERAWIYNGAYGKTYSNLSQGGAGNPGLGSLSAWWTMNEAGWTRSDGTGVNPLTDVTSRNSVGNTPGKAGYAAAFEAGNQEFLEIADTPSLSTGDIDFTVSAWFKLNQVPSVIGYQIVAGKADSGTSLEWLLYADPTNNQLIFTTYNSSGALAGAVYATSAGALTANTWYHVTAWHDAAGNTVNIQVNNGVVNSAGTAGAPADTSAAFRIGAMFTAELYHFNGAIDEVVFYKKTLTAAERTWLYNGGAGRTYADLSVPTPPANASVTYNYASGHAHAVSSLSIGNTYGYDANGNQTTRHIATGTLAGDYVLNYDAENRLVGVTKNGASIASFVYDGDGKQVRATVNNVTTIYVGSHYEVQGGSITKYYFAGSTRIALRKDGVLNYLLSDHLGSSSITTDANGVAIAKMLYTAWGETRYASGDLKTDYEYTGQRNENEIGLHFYGARWYDSQLGRFVQADTMIPQSQGVQAYDRFAYVNNNPLRYTDPTGHRNCEEDGYHCAGWDYYKPIKPTSTPTPTPSPTPSPVITSGPTMTPTMTPTIIPTVTPTVTPTGTPTLPSNPQANINPTPNGGIPYVGPPPPILEIVFVVIPAIYIGAINGNQGDGAPGYGPFLGPLGDALDVVLSIPEVWEKLNYVDRTHWNSSFVPTPDSTPYISNLPVPIVAPSP